MITLNIDKKLKAIEKWEDIESRPGFAARLDPKTIKLKEIIGRYIFPFDIPCGLSNCRTRHKHGFLVVATDGRETNLGRICGKREFGADFNSLSKVFVAAERAQRNRETLHAIKDRLPAIRLEIQHLREDPYAADWIRPRVRSLTGYSSTLPDSIIKVVRQIVRSGSGAITVQRALTKEERDARAAASGGERQSHISAFMEEKVGQLEGYPALAADDPLRTATRTIEDFLEELEKADIDNLQDRHLRELTKRSTGLDRNLDHLRETITAGRRLLTQQNIRQLSRFATTRPDAKLLNLFLQELPA